MAKDMRLSGRPAEGVCVCCLCSFLSCATNTTGEISRFNHFIRPIIQQYAHLHQYILEEQDTKVRQEH